MSLLGATWKLKGSLSFSLFRLLAPSNHHAPFGRPPYSHPRRRWQHATAQDVENTNLDHSRFVAEAPARAKWKETEEAGRGIDATSEDFESVTEGKGMFISASKVVYS